MPRVIHICNGCDEKFIEYEDLWFDNCCECWEEVCRICGSVIDGKVYCRDHKPLFVESEDF